MPDFPTGDERDAPYESLLEQFVRALQDLLGELVERGNDTLNQPLFHEELIDGMRRAWPEVQGHFDDLAKATGQIPDEEVERHALSGEPLLFKLRVAKFFVDRFRIEWRPGVLRRALDAIEGLLDSIIDAAGAGGAVKEIKEAIRNSTRDE